MTGHVTPPLCRVPTPQFTLQGVGLGLLDYLNWELSWVQGKLNGRRSCELQECIQNPDPS